MDKKRFDRQIKFILEIEKLKNIFRQSYILDTDRHENDGEHSWHIAMAACILFEYASEPVDQLRTLKMLLVHDLVEIHASDTFCYDESANNDKAERENISAQKIFGILPEDQKDEIINLWEDFEERKSPEARFASAIDRFIAFLLNYNSGGRIWNEHGVKEYQVLKRMAPVKDGSNDLWEHVKMLIDEAVVNGLLSE